MNRDGRKPMRRPGGGISAKKAMAVLMALCMLFAMMPAYTAGAAEAKANTADYALYYSTADGMLHQNSSTGTVVKSTEGMEYEGNGNTLTLKGFHFETEVVGTDWAGLVMPENTMIVLQGENYIRNDYNYGIRGKGALTISGDGSLTASGWQAGIYAASGFVTINGGNINVVSPGENEDNSDNYMGSKGIWALNLKINGGVINAKGTAASEDANSAGLYAMYDITITDGTVEAIGVPSALYSSDPSGKIAIANKLQILAGTDAENAQAVDKYTNEYYVKIAPPAPELPPEHKHCICGADEENHTGHGEKINYTPLGEDGLADGKFSKGNYYLTENVTLNENIAVEGEVNLCLNGHTVSCGEFQWKNSVGTLNICDCVGDEKNSGKIQGTHSPLVSAGGTVNLYGGSIEGTVNSAMGIDEHGEVNLYGGTVKGDAAGISLMQGNLNLYGGEIRGSETGAGSVQGTLTIRGGEISGISSVSGIVNAAGGTIKTAKAGGEDSFDIDLAAGGKLNLGGSPNLSSVQFDKTEQISASYEDTIYSGDSTITIIPSKNFEDTFKEDQGIAVSNITKDINDRKFTLRSEKYTMEPVDTDLVIKPRTHTVTLETGEGYTWKTDGSDTLEADEEMVCPVRHGDSFSFSFVLRDGYHKTNDFAVKVNNNTIPPVTDPGNESGSEQHYIIENITEDKTVTAEGIEKDPPVVPPTDPPGTTVPGSLSSSTGATTSGSSSSSTGTTTSGSSSSSGGAINPSSSSSSAGTTNPSSSTGTTAQGSSSSSVGTVNPSSSSSSAGTTNPGSSESSSSSVGAGGTSTAAPGTADPTAPSNTPAPGGENGGSEPEISSNGGKDKEPAGKAEPGKDAAGGNTAGRDGEAAQTGDESDPELYFGLLILSLLGIAGAAGSRRKKKQ